MAEVEAKNKFRIGDTLELITPVGNHRFVAGHIEDLTGAPLDEVPGGGWRVRVGVPTSAASLGLITRILG